jgi:tRNA (cytidine56-2'-O)-methyltransferase
VTRAFGADELVLDANDPDVEESLRKVNLQWGGKTDVLTVKDWKRYAREFPGEKIHLTMYGTNLNDCMDEIKASGKDKLIIIGGQKVPPEAYEIADYNVGIGNQPHSEVAALAVFLDRLFDGKELEKKFSGKKTIVPQRKGKKILQKDI